MTAKTKNKKTQSLLNKIESQNFEIERLNSQIDTILGTTRWKLMDKAIKIGYKVGLMQLIRIIISFSKDGFAGFEKKDLYQDQPPVSFNPYDFLQFLKDIPVKLVDKDCKLSDRQPFSMATTIFNEGVEIIDFIKSIESQSMRPDEVILVDGGSDDDTVSHVKMYMKKSKLNIKLIEGRNLNIPQGRNRAIKESKKEIIVLADAGTVLDKNYCRNLVGCFNKYKKVDLVGGIYHPIKATKYSKYFIPDWNEIDWKYFLPSTRSMALRRSLVKKAGFYPEHLQTGDDTLLDINYRKISRRWIFNKKVSVQWEAPSNKAQYLKLAHNYGRGDGMSGIGDFWFNNFLLRDKKNLPIYDPLSRIEFYKGYLEGRKKRASVDILDKKISGLVIVFADYPINDKLNSKLFRTIKNYLKRNFKIIYVNILISKDGNLQKRYIDIDHTLMEFYHLDDFDVQDLLKRYKKIKKKIKIINEANNSLADLLAAKNKKK